MKELKDDEIKALLERIISKAEDFSTSTLQKEREEVLEYYRGQAPTPQHKGDAKYVSRDVFDAVDTARSNIVETFGAHSRIIKFKAEYGETVAQAKQATEYCRHVFFKDNPGEDLIDTAVYDGLMNRFAVAKVYYQEVKDEIEHELGGLTEDELETFVADMYDFEFNEVDSSSLAVGVYSGSLTEVKLKKKIVVEMIQPEDLRVLGRTASLLGARAVIHTQEMTKSKLIKAGYDKKKVTKLNFESKNPSTIDYEKQHRFSPIGTTLGTEDDDMGESNETVTLHEVYAELDLLGTGVNRKWRIAYAGGEVLEKEQINRYPFASFVPIPVPHTFFGENYAKSVIPIQNARTVMMRQIINHAVRTNNDRMMVLKGTLHNPKELLENRVGGIVNVNRMDGLAPLQQAMLNPFVFDTVRLLDEDKEEVTGISKLSQGLSKEAISTQNAEGKIDQLIQLSQQRQKTFARRFGRFMAELWYLIYHVALDHIDEAAYVAVTGQYVEVNPSAWRERSAASVELTLTEDEDTKEAIKFRELDTYFTQHPALGDQYTPDKRWEVLSRMTEKMGVEDLDAILLSPEQVPPKEPDPIQQLTIAELQAKVDHLKAQAAQLQGKTQVDMFKAQTERMVKMAELKIDTAELELEKEELEHDKQIDWAEVRAAEKAAEASTETKTSAVWSPNS
jgi:hypothetical protein